MRTEPDPALAAARAALRAHPRTRAWSTLKFEPLEGGLSNRSWRLEADGERYVVRLSGDDDAALGVDRASEAALLETAGAAGLAPPLVIADPARHLLVTRYVDGEVWSRDDARDSRNVVRMAHVLTRLHALAPPPGVRVRSFREAALRLQRVASERGAATDSRLATRAEDVFARLASGAGQTLCHDDLHHLNVLDDGHALTLIDWEYGGRGDPVYDLASFVSCHELEADARALLWNAYAGPADPGRFTDALWSFDFVQWLWYLVAGGGADEEASACRERAERVRVRLAT
jgi:thiamine kinase-like enzyme